MPSPLLSFLRKDTALPWFVRGALAAVLGAGAMGCTPSIGDKCSLSTDCSIRGDRQCDTAQPDGYCTVLNCGGDSCPEDGACVLFHASIPGCGYDDRSVARTARSFCMAACEEDSDCRSGYICRSPRRAPWSAVILDTDQSKRACVPRSDENASFAETDNPDAGVCQRSAAESDAGLTVITPSADAGTLPDADAAADAATDAGVDATLPEAGVDAGVDDAGLDAGILDSGIADAQGGG